MFGVPLLLRREGTNIMLVLLMTTCASPGFICLNTSLMLSKSFITFRLMSNAFWIAKSRPFSPTGVVNTRNSIATFNARASLTECHVHIPLSGTVLPCANTDIWSRPVLLCLRTPLFHFGFGMMLYGMLPHQPYAHSGSQQGHTSVPSVSCSAQLLLPSDFWVCLLA